MIENNNDTKNKFLIDLTHISSHISSIGVGSWAVIGSSCLAAHDLIDRSPKDINIVMNHPKLMEISRHYGIEPAYEISEDGMLSYIVVKLTVLNRQVVCISKLNFLTPTGIWRPVHTADLRTETIVRNNFRCKNILTVEGYMSLAGIFNRPKDRESLARLYAQAKEAQAEWNSKR